MKKNMYLAVSLMLLLSTSCTLAVQKHGYWHDKDLEITVDNGCEETTLLSVDHDDSVFGKSFRLAMPFINVNVYEDTWNNEKYIDIDLFR